MERLLAKGQRFIAVIGASGSGKSSLVYAGLIPKLTASSGVAGAHWLPVTFSPRELGDDPFQPLAAALNKKFPDRGWRVPNLMQRLRNNPHDIAAIAKQALGENASSAQLLLFVDQFEEVFAGIVDTVARAAFFQLLSAAIACPLLRVVIAMRSDFYDKWPQDQASIGLLNSGHFPVAVPGQAALEKMIVCPAQAAGLTFKPPLLVQRILADTGTGPGALALVEFALAKLYEMSSDDNTLTETAYERIGGVAGAIDELAEEAVNNAGDPLDEEALSRLFLAIASVEEKGQELAVVRRRAAKSELPEAARNLAQQLVDERLLVSTGGGTSDQPAVYEVGHEAVFTHWKRFKKWHEVYGEDLALRRQTERAAADWEKASRARAMCWVWERQKPALEALRKLNQLSPAPPDADVADTGIATWQILKAKLPESKPPLRSFLHPEPLALLEELNCDETPQQRREEIGLRLNQLGYWRRGVGLNNTGLPDIMWIDIPAGEVTLETGDWIRFKAFRLARYPVTWAQYRVFLNASDGYREPAWWEGRPREKDLGALTASFGSYPAINISWYDALAYCRWLSAKLSLDIRLPTEWEWQWAAVGDAQQEYPWSGEWNVARANSDQAGIGHTVAVGLYPLGRSPFGIDDLAGNVWEWCLNAYDEPTNVSLKEDVFPVRRGGSWDFDPGSCRAAHRETPRSKKSDRYHLGFRLCCGPPVNNLGIETHRSVSRDRASTTVAARDGVRFKRDVFISYAHEDNTPLTPEQNGWVTRLHVTLEELISMRLGRRARIWQDDKLRGNDVFTSEISDLLAQTAVFVSVLTPHYLRSERCARELREFCEQAEQSGGVIVGNKTRVLKVLKAPVDTQGSLPFVLKDTLGYEFFFLKDGTPLELDRAYGEMFDQEYLRKVARLSWDISQLLKTLATETGDSDKGNDAHATAKAIIYLAECSYDRKEIRETLEGELRRGGYTVLPDRQLPHDEAEYVAVVERLLARCNLAVHLVGASYGAVPDGPSQKSVVVLQNELAVRRSKSSALSRVIWLPEGTRSQQAPQQAFIKALPVDAETQFGADLITGDIEALKTSIYATLKKLENSKPKRLEGQAAPASRAKLI